MFGTGTITPNGKAIGGLIIDSSTGTTTLAGAVSCTTYAQTSGNIDFANFNLTCSSTATYTAGTLSNIGTITCTTWACTGAFTLTQGTITPSTSFTVAGSFNYNGGTLSPVATFTQTGTSVVTLGKAYALAATGTYTLTAGTLNLNGFDLTTGIFASAGTGVRSIAFGTNNIVLAHTTAATTVLSMATNMGNFTWTGTGGFTAAANITRTYVFGTTGGSSTSAPNLTLTGSGTAVQTFTTNSWFNKLDFGTTAFNPGTTSLNLNSLTLSSAGTYTGLTATMQATGTITPTGKTIAAFTINNGAGTTTLAGALGCTTYVNTTGTIDFATFNLTCSSTGNYTAGTLSNIGTIICTTWNVNGGATFTLTQGTINGSTSFVTNTGIFNYAGGTITTPFFDISGGTINVNATFTLPSTCTLAHSTGTLNLNGFDLSVGIFGGSAANTRTIAFGSNNIILTGSGNVLACAGVTNNTITGTGGFTADASVARTYTYGTTGGSASNAVNLSITSGASVPTFTDGSWFDVLNFTGTTCAPAMSASAIGIYVDTLTLATGGTYTGFIPVLTRTQTWTAQFSKQLGGIGVGNVGATLTLDNTQTYTQTAPFLLTAGTLNLGGYDFTIGTFISNNTNTRSIAFGSNSITLATTTSAAVNLSMANGTGFSWTGTGGFKADADRTRTFTIGTTAGIDATNIFDLTFTGSGALAQSFTTGSWVRKVDFGTTAFNTGVITLNLASVIFSTGGTFSLSLNMVDSGIINTNGKTVSSLSINHTGTTTLASAVTITNLASGQVTLTSGTLDLAGFTVTTSSFSSNNSNTRAINFGSGASAANIVLASTVAGVAGLSMATITGLTCTGTGGFTTAMSITRTFTCGSTAGSEINAPNLFLTSGASVPTFTDGSWFKNLNFTGTTSTPAVSASVLGIAVDTLTLATGGTYTALIPCFTRTQTWTPQFSKQLGGIGVAAGTLTLEGTQTYAANPPLVLRSGTLDLGGADRTFGAFLSNNANTRSIAFGANNIILNHTTAATVVLSMANATGFSYTGTGGFAAAADIARTYTCGTTGGNSAGAPSVTLTGSGTAVQTFTTASWFNKLDFGTTAFAVATTTLNLNSLILSSGGTFTSLTATMVGTGIVTPNAKTIAAFTINHSGTTTISSGNSGSNYKVYTWNSSGTMTMPANFTVQYLVVAGGGAGGGGHGGGGGAGGLLAGNLALVSGSTYSITVGAGGAGLANGFTNTSAGSNGTTSAFANVASAIGGGGGATGNDYTSAGYPGNNGGSGGGGSLYTAVPGTGTAGQGNAGGAQGNYFDINYPGGDDVRAGGGGGAGAAGTTGKYSAGANRGNGGIGVVSTIAGVYTYYAGGGGGGGWNQSLTGVAAGGLGGGGSGGRQPSTVAGSGATNTGGGGGGGSYGGPSGAGGSGIVIVRYLATYPDLTTTGSPSTAVVNAGSDTLFVTGQTNLLSGTLELGVCYLSTGTFSSTNTNTRSISFGLSFISLTTATAAQVNLNMANATNFTCTGTGGFSSAMSTTRTFTFGTTGGSASNAPNLTLAYGSSVPTITTGSWFNVLDIAPAVPLGTTTLNLTSIYFGQAIAIDSLVNLTANMQGGGGLYYNNSSTANPTIGTININHPGLTTTITDAFRIKAGTVNLTAGTLRIGDGTTTSDDFNCGIFNSNNSNVRAIEFNAYLYLATNATSGATVLNMSDMTNFSYSGSYARIKVYQPVSQTIVAGVTGATATNALTVEYGKFANTGTTTITTGSTFKDFYISYDSGYSHALTLPATTINLYGTYNVGADYTAITVNFIGDNIAHSIGTNGYGTTIGGLGAIYTFTGNIVLDSPGGTLVLTNYMTMQNLTILQGKVLFGGAEWWVANKLTSTGTGVRGIRWTASTSFTSIVYLGVASPLTNANCAAGTKVIDIPDLTNFTVEYASTTNSGTHYLEIETRGVAKTIDLGSATMGISPTSSNTPKVRVEYLTTTSIITLTDNSYFDFLWIGVASSSVPLAVTGTTYGINIGSSLNYAATQDCTSLIPVYHTTTTFNNSRTWGGIGVGNGANVTINNTNGTAYTITSKMLLKQGNINLSNANWTFGSLVSSNTNTRSLIFGTGSLALATTAVAQTVLDMADATGFTWTGTGNISSNASVTRTYTFGTTGGSAANALNLAITSGASVPTFTDGSWFKTLNFTGSNCTPAMSDTILGINVDTLTLSSTGTYINLIPAFTRTQTVTAQSNRQLGGINVNHAGVTVTLDSTQAFTSTSVCTLNKGTLNLGGVNQNFGYFNTDGTQSRSITNPGSISVYYDWTVGNNTNLSGLGALTIYMKGLAASTFAGGNSTYGTLVQQSTNALTITGSNTFADVKTGFVIAPGVASYTTAGTYSWTVPTGVTSVSAVLVGGGSGAYNAVAGTAGGGGGLRWINDLPVTPGETITVVVGDAGVSNTTTTGIAGGHSSLSRGATELIRAPQGTSAGNLSPTGTLVSGSTSGAGAGYIGGGEGGRGGSGVQAGLGGGGAGGYAGNGGTGGSGGAGSSSVAAGGGGGGGGTSVANGTGGNGGSVGIFGQGTGGAGGAVSASTTGNAGTSGSVTGAGAYGAGAGARGDGGAAQSRVPTRGAIRIIWGTGRAFPALNASTAADTLSQATTISFEANSTTTLTNFTATGTSGNVLTLNSSVPGTQFNLRKTSGTVNTNYLIVQDSNASAAFFANSNSTDSGNNTGWNFTTPSAVQGNFANFF
jgi:hypothetical protein